MAKPFNELPPNVQDRITKLLEAYNEAINKKTDKGSAVHSFDYAIEQGMKKSFYKKKTAEYYIKIYG